jgi:hypothetical protein
MRKPSLRRTVAKAILGFWIFVAALIALSILLYLVWGTVELRPVTIALDVVLCIVGSLSALVWAIKELDLPL